MVICTALATVYADCDYMSEQMDEMLYGEEAEILEEKNGFYKTRSEYGYVGWTPKANLFCKIKEPNYTVVSPFSDLLTEGRYNLAPYMALPRGSKVYVEIPADSTRWGFVSHPNEHTFYIHKRQLAPIENEALTENEVRERLTAVAKEYLGVQYRWGGRSHLGIDCSGLCFNAYKFNNILIWRDADIDRSVNLRQIRLDDAKQGDLIFFKGHVAMYLGDDMIIHSTASKGGVVIENLRENQWLMDNMVAVGTAF